MTDAIEAADSEAEEEVEAEVDSETLPEPAIEESLTDASETAPNAENADLQISPADEDKAAEDEPAADIPDDVKSGEGDIEEAPNGEEENK